MKELLDLISQPTGAAIMQNITLLPVVAGLLLLLIPDKVKYIKEAAALAVSGYTGLLALALFSWQGNISALATGFYSDFFTLNIDKLSRMIILLISCFTILVIIYSLLYNRQYRVTGFYSWLLITLGCSNGAAASDNLIVFLVFWGILGISLYKMLPGKDEESSAAAKKTLILIGASDSIMMIGIAILWRITGTLNMSEMSVGTGDAVRVVAFFALLAGSFTKAGAFPFHTWVPAFSKSAPASSSSYLPAAIDKLLGIYFLCRIINDIFSPGELITLFLLLTGVVTIITAVMMALNQHNYKQLLGYHAVSQVGYMIVGLSLGTPLGIAAGLFHMINNAVYKGGLFMTAGSVELRASRNEIEDLGGLAKMMPFTFFAGLIFALSISGIPPLNGFASKWMIYHAIIEFGKGSGIAHDLWILWLGLAVIGSALTLASFIKFIGGIFLGRIKEDMISIREVPVAMYCPALILALVCIFFGVSAGKLIVPGLLVPVTGEFEVPGLWDSGAVFLLVLISICAGVIIYFLTGKKKFRTSDSFIGGETFHDRTGFPAPEFYRTISEFRLIERLYLQAEKQWFDIYRLSSLVINWANSKISRAHNGLLPTYVVWVFAGLMIMLLIMI